jgi:hypothetical protein
MVQAVISLTEHENRILNILKGKYGLKNKSEAVEHVIKAYEEDMLEPELRPEYIDKLKKIEKEKTVKVKDFRQHFGLDE